MFADADERADVVEKIHKKENEDEFTEAEFRSGMKIQFQKCSGRMRQGKQLRGPVREAEGDSRGGDDKNAEKNCAGDFTRHENCGEKKSRDGEEHAGIGKFSEADESGGIGDDEIRVAHSNEGDEEADAGGGAVLEAIGNVVDDAFADFGERQKKENYAGEKDNAESGLPGNASADDDGISEVGVEGHAGRESDRIVGPETHDQRGERGGDAGGEEDAVGRHTRFCEDARVYDDDVGHGEERGETGEKFAADGGAVFLE